MIYEQKAFIPATTQTVKHEVSPCVKCGSENIKIEEYEDQYGFISTATCQSCKQEVKANTTAVGVIGNWNQKNDIQSLLAAKLKLVERAKNEIKDLQILQSQRLKASKKKPNN